MFSSVKTKTNPNFAVNLAESRGHSFSLSIWWIIFFKHLYSLIRKKTYEKGQKQPSSHSCTELRKIQFLPGNIFNFFVLGNFKILRTNYIMCVVRFDCVMHQPRILKCGNYKIFANLARRNAKRCFKIHEVPNKMYFNKIFNNSCNKCFTESHPVLGLGLFFRLWKVTKIYGSV